MQNWSPRAEQFLRVCSSRFIKLDLSSLAEAMLGERKGICVEEEKLPSPLMLLPATALAAAKSKDWVLHGVVPLHVNGSFSLAQCGTELK